MVDAQPITASRQNLSSPCEVSLEFVTGLQNSMFCTGGQKRGLSGPRLYFNFKTQSMQLFYDYSTTSSTVLLSRRVDVLGKARRRAIQPAYYVCKTTFTAQSGKERVNCSVLLTCLYRKQHGSRVFVHSSAECSGREDLYSCSDGQVQQQSILHT